MEALRTYLNSLAPEKQTAFAGRCGTTVNYLRNAISTGKKLGDGLVINIERESGGAVRCEQLREDVDWEFLRGTSVSPVPADGDRKAS